MENLTQQVDTLFTNMENFTQNDSLIGKPVSQGDKTFLPVMSITLGYGGGDTQSKAKQTNAASSGSMGGGALGLGAKLCTDAVIVIDKDNVMFAPINAAGNVSQIINQIPQIIGSMQSGGQSGQQPGAQTGQQPGQTAH